MKRFLIFILCVEILSACEKAVDFYIGIPFQPKFDDNTFTPGLNIFGILRTDSTGNYNNSFIDIQQVIPILQSTDSLYIDTANVTVHRILEPEIKEPYNFSFSDSDNNFTQSKYRPEGTFNPQPGEIYTIDCRYKDLPVLHATTIIPKKAIVAPNTLSNDGKTLFFETLWDTSIFMLDVYVYYNKNMIATKRYATESEKNTKIEIELNNNSFDSICIYSYDYNIAKYYLSSNTSFNFNKYRNSYSTVENGYGVFGSINFSGAILP